MSYKQLYYTNTDMAFNMPLNKYLTDNDMAIVTNTFPYSFTIQYKHYALGIGQDVTKYIIDKKAIIIRSHSISKYGIPIDEKITLYFINKDDYIKTKILL